MGLVIPNGKALCAFVFSVAGDPDRMITTLGVDVAAMSGGDQENIDAVADSFISAFPAAALVEGWIYHGVSARVGYPGGVVVTIESPRVHVGTTNSETPPQNCAVLVRKRTVVAGRRGQGRMYVPPFAVTEVAVNKAGVIAPGDLANLQNAFNAWFNHGEPWVLLHDDVPAPMEPTPITGFVVDGRIATQRRRLRH